MMLKKLQSEQIEWVEHNFGKRPTWMPLVGVMEELGELAHAYLKKEQGIRISENHEEKLKDAIGDIVIYLADFCTAHDFDLATIVKETWKTVKIRDWIKYPVNGMDK